LRAPLACNQAGRKLENRQNIYKIIGNCSILLMEIGGSAAGVGNKLLRPPIYLFWYRSPTCHRHRGCESLQMTTDTQKHVLDLPNAFSELEPLISFLRGARALPVEIDCSAVTVLPTRCLQLLLGAEQQWRSEGLGFSVINITESCRRALSLMGLEANRFEDEETA
jgi:anti-anti-sigma regulatory factor